MAACKARLYHGKTGDCGQSKELVCVIKWYTREIKRLGKLLGFGQNAREIIP